MPDENMAVTAHRGRQGQQEGGGGMEGGYTPVNEDEDEDEDEDYGIGVTDGDRDVDDDEEILAHGFKRGSPTTLSSTTENFVYTYTNI